MKVGCCGPPLGAKQKKMKRVQAQISVYAWVAWCVAKPKALETCAVSLCFQFC